MLCAQLFFFFSTKLDFWTVVALMKPFSRKKRSVSVLTPEVFRVQESFSSTGPSWFLWTQLVVVLRANSAGFMVPDSKILPITVASCISCVDFLAWVFNHLSRLTQAYSLRSSPYCRAMSRISQKFGTFQSFAPCYLSEAAVRDAAQPNHVNAWGLTLKCGDRPHCYTIPRSASSFFFHLQHSSKRQGNVASRCQI